MMIAWMKSRESGITEIADEKRCMTLLKKRRKHFEMLSYWENKIIYIFYELNPPKISPLFHCPLLEKRVLYFIYTNTFGSPLHMYKYISRLQHWNILSNSRKSSSSELGKCKMEYNTGVAFYFLLLQGSIRPVQSNQRRNWPPMWLPNHGVEIPRWILRCLHFIDLGSS